MIRRPAVAGQFYPADPRELSALIHRYTTEPKSKAPMHVRSCLVPHAGYVYSGPVAGAVFSRIVVPNKILILGVRHYPRGESLAILSEGAWRTPLGDVPIDGDLAARLRTACPALREDSVAHSREHSLEVELPFLQVRNPGFSFVPVALGTTRFEELVKVGEGVARVLAESEEDILIVTSSDMNHYEDEEITRRKDQQAIDRMLQLDAKGLYEVCREQEISMCGLGPAVATLTALQVLGVKCAEVVRYATSAETSGDRSAVVGYAGMIFS